MGTSVEAWRSSRRRADAWPSPMSATARTWGAWCRHGRPDAPDRSGIDSYPDPAGGAYGGWGTTAAAAPDGGQALPGWMAQWGLGIRMELGVCSGRTVRHGHIAVKSNVDRRHSVTFAKTRVAAAPSCGRLLAAGSRPSTAVARTASQPATAAGCRVARSWASVAAQREAAGQAVAP